MPGFEIGAMTRPDVDIALEWAAMEGWNPGLHDADPFFRTDPQGWFMARVEGEPVGCISAVAYGRDFGFIGFFMVRKDLRGGRIGIELGRMARARLEGRMAGLDGVEAKVRNYVHFGYEFAWRNVRYSGAVRTDPPGWRTDASGADIVPIASADFDALCDYDRGRFGADRRVFLESWTAMPGAIGRAAARRGVLAGYGVARRCRSGWKVGPLFADGADVALDLFRSLAEAVPAGEVITLDCPEPNGAAAAMALAHGMRPVFSTVRMYSGGIPKIPLGNIYGITSFELG